uniref:Uncharacterized protein n=1 Tax=viral metagenome TaxID=1070528 RepID=A0A6C0KD26_9ZZZZ
MESFKNISKEDIFRGIISPELLEQCPFIYRNICFHCGMTSLSHKNKRENTKNFTLLKILSNIIDNPVAVSQMCLWIHTRRLLSFTNRVPDETENSFAEYKNVIHSHFWKWRREKVVTHLAVFLKARRRIIVKKIIEPKLNTDVTGVVLSYL